MTVLWLIADKYLSASSLLLYSKSTKERLKLNSNVCNKNCFTYIFCFTDLLTAFGIWVQIETLQFLNYIVQIDIFLWSKFRQNNWEYVCYVIYRLRHWRSVDVKLSFRRFQSAAEHWSLLSYTYWSIFAKLYKKL